jgi:hypothetical protein
MPLTAQAGSAISKFELFRFVATSSNRHSGARPCASPESMTPAGSMESGPALLASNCRLEVHAPDVQLHIGEWQTMDHRTGFVECPHDG